MLERLARPLSGLSSGIASIVNAFYRVLGGPGKLLQDFLNGSWLGHSVHAVLTDVVVGGATVAVVLDLLRVVFGVDGLEVANAWVVGIVWLGALSAIVTGLTDFKDTATGNERNVTGLHGLINIVAWLAFSLSLIQRLGGSHDAGFWTFLIGYLIVSVGAYIGGHVVFKYGYMVNFNAFQKGRRAKEFTALVPLADLPENAPTKVSLGPTALVVVRRGDVVHALKETCSHAGGPLSEGRLEGDAIVCPWHGSTFRLADGSVRHGPASARQVRYETRVAGEQVEVLGPLD
jgi:nitrite reductase/ring-hydroxylating ferredoxin subunit